MNALTVTPAVTISKAIRISLTQFKADKQIINASFVFNAIGDNLDGFIKDTSKRIVKIFELQNSIKARTGKANFLGLTKNGEFELNIKVLHDNEIVKQVTNVLFKPNHIENDADGTGLLQLVEAIETLTYVYE